MDWRAKVDLFEQLRREHEFGIGTIAGVAAKFGVHRRVVRQALVNAVPAKHHYPERAKPKLGAFVAFIDEVLADPARLPAGGDGAVHGVPLTLAVCRGVLHARRGS